MSIYVGQKIGNLTVLSYAGKEISKHLWLCGCRCGWYSTQRQQNLLRDVPAQSCGHCKPNIRFKLEHESWEAMKSRCYIKNRKDYHRYGGRGITVCDTWRKDFFNFLEDVGFRPSLKHTLDRIDTNDNYYKENCKWSTAIEQNNNRNIRNTFNIVSTTTEILS